MPTRGNDAPLLVTAALDHASQDCLDSLRRRYFPPALNKVPAHISLFHQLPGTDVDRVLADARGQCRGRSAFDLRPQGLRFLGRGVAIAYEAQELLLVHAGLARTWIDWLTAQDRQPFKPHLTIQNKVAPAVARHLYDSMVGTALPACRVEGVAIWRYLGGPWEPVETVPFTPQYGVRTS